MYTLQCTHTHTHTHAHTHPYKHAPKPQAPLTPTTPYSQSACFVVAVSRPTVLSFAFIPTTTHQEAEAKPLAEWAELFAKEKSAKKYGIVTGQVAADRPVTIYSNIRAENVQAVVGRQAAALNRLPARAQ